MSNETYLEQSSRDLLGLLPTTQLTRTILKMARAKQEEAIDDMYINSAEKAKRKESLFDAYMHLVLRMKAKKTAKEREFEELYEEEMRDNPTYKPPAPKKKPTELVITNSPAMSGFFLLKGTIEDIREIFGEWLIKNKLLAQDFSWEMNAIMGMKNTFALRMHGPAEGPHAEKLGGFFQELVRNGYISPRENVNAPSLVPTPPRPGGKKKKEEEEEQQQRKPGILNPFAPPTPYKK